MKRYQRILVAALTVAAFGYIDATDWAGVPGDDRPSMTAVVINCLIITPVVLRLTKIVSDGMWAQRIRRKH